MNWDANSSWLGLDGKRSEPPFGFQKCLLHDFDETNIDITSAGFVFGQLSCCFFLQYSMPALSSVGLRGLRVRFLAC